MSTQTIESLCVVNPEVLGAATPQDMEFRYVDISAVTRGRIDWSTTQVWRYAEAPSRARRRLRVGDVLLCTVRPGLQAHARIREDDALPMVGSTGFAVLRPNETSDSGFVFHLIFSDAVATQLRALETGSSYPAVNESDVRGVRVFCPAKEERARIAVVLDTVDAAIAQTEAVMAKLKQVRAGLLHDFLTRGLDANGQLRDPLAHPEQFRDSALGCIPKDWDISTLPTFATWQNGQPFPSSQYRDQGVRLLRPGNLSISEFVSWDGLETCLPESWALLASEYLVRGDELIMNLTAQSLEGGFLGRVCMTRSNELCLLNQRLARLRTKDVHLPFLFWCLRGPHFRKQMDRIPQGTKVKHLYNRDLEQTLVAVPKSVDEQNAIADALFALAQQTESESHELAKLPLLKSGLMSDLLTGRVRVPEAPVGDKHGGNVP